jgi:hypothetical protein
MAVNNFLRETTTEPEFNITTVGVVNKIPEPKRKKQRAEEPPPNPLLSGERKEEQKEKRKLQPPRQPSTAGAASFLSSPNYQIGNN